MTQIPIPDQTFSQLEQAAQQQEMSAAELAARILRDHLRVTAPDPMTQEMEAYSAQHPKILEKYRGEYIAMYHSEIVDHDSDLHTLYLRIDERFPDKTVLLKQVQEQVEEILNVPSFRIISS